MNITKRILNILHVTILKRKAIKKIKNDFKNIENSEDAKEILNNIKNEFANILSFNEWLIFVEKIISSNLIKLNINEKNNKNSQYIYDLIHSNNKKLIFTSIIIATIQYYNDTLKSIQIVVSEINKISNKNRNLYFRKLSEYTHQTSKNCVIYPINDKKNISMSVELQKIALKYRM